MGDERDFRRGKESNIPLCCIRFYTHEWKDPEVFRAHTEAMYATGILSYIPCPGCLKKKQFNWLALDEGGYLIPLVLGWRYKNKTTGTLWTMTGMDYVNNTIYWVGMTEDGFSYEYEFPWTFVQHSFEPLDHPITN